MTPSVFDCLILEISRFSFFLFRQLDLKILVTFIKSYQLRLFSLKESGCFRFSKITVIWRDFLHNLLSQEVFVWYYSVPLNLDVFICRVLLPSLLLKIKIRKVFNWQISSLHIVTQYTNCTNSFYILKLSCFILSHDEIIKVYGLQHITINFYLTLFKFYTLHLESCSCFNTKVFILTFIWVWFSSVPFSHSLCISRYFFVDRSRF